MDGLVQVLFGVSGDYSYDRSLVCDLSRCGWESLKVFFQETLPKGGAVPGADVLISGDIAHFGKYFGKTLWGIQIRTLRDYI